MNLQQNKRKNSQEKSLANLKKDCANELKNKSKKRFHETFY